MRPKTVAMVQSNYVPWKGYFDQINMADLFVFYDDVQYTKDDWRNRNKIKTRDGLKWITVPCGSDINRRICDVKVESDYWQKKHWSMICHNYSKAEHFQRYRKIFETLYLGRSWSGLAELNQTFIKTICDEILGIPTRFGDSRDYELPPDAGKEDRWIGLLKMIGAERFIIGPAARDYLAPQKQAEIEGAGIELIWMDYSDYPEYRQLFPPFEHRVSIIDLIMNEGPDAPKYMKSWK